MRKIKMNVTNDLTFEQGCEEYIRDCKARNLRDGTILNVVLQMNFDLCWPVF